MQAAVLKKAKGVASSEESAKILKAYLDEVHPADLKEAVQDTYKKYAEDAEAKRKELEAEKEAGVHLVDYVTGWREQGYEHIFSPEIDLKLKCISRLPSKIRVVFKKANNNEIYGKNVEYLDSSTVSVGDVFTLMLNSDVGYRNAFDWYELDRLPAMKVDVYISKDSDEDYKLWKTYNIKKGYLQTMN